MIHPKAIKEFIIGKRDNHAWMKKLKHRELDLALRAVGFKAASKKSLLKHQKVCILLGIAYKCFAFWIDMGTGKTRVALELLNYWWKHGELDRAIIEVPSEPALIGWENQIKEWRIKIPFLTLGNSSSKYKWEQIEDFDTGLIMVTYPGLVRMLSVKKVVPFKKKKRKLVLDNKLIKKLMNDINAQVLDEATKVGHHTSLIYQANNKMADYASIKYELAGRPFGRDPTMLWPQMYILDRGETLGDTLGMFRIAFFRAKRNFWGATEYIFKKSMKKDLNRILRHRSITYSAEECIDLPKVVSKIEEVSLPKEAQSYYNQYVKELKSKKSSLIERQNAFIRMRQVSSGFLGMLDDDTGSRMEFAFAVNPKLDRLMELMEGIPPGHKFVIFHEFIQSGKMVSEALNKVGIKHVTLWGSTKDSRGFQDKFDNDDGVSGGVINHKKGAYALNLQRANYLFFYESPVSVLDRVQARARCIRKGQNRTVFETDLVCRGTADPRILDFHKEGGSLLEALIRSKGKSL